MDQKISIITSNFGITDLIDILIITFLVYKLMSFIRSTRAEQLAKGLVIVLAATWLSELCHFYVVHWILEKVISVGLIALVVVFQPELRRGLERIGRKRFGSKAFSLDVENISKQVEVIVRSIEYFSQRKEGALIVIEKETALADIAETGTIIDALLTEQALENLFYKGSPLHDGAVILRSDRIYAAGCVLPLTTNQNLSKDLGTRHRAGIGISEVSDAIVLIVSEETGIISMAVDGKLSRFLDLKTVEKYLMNVYISGLNDNRSFIDRINEFFRGKKHAAE